MAITTLNRPDTDKLLSMRTQNNESGNLGDFFKGFYQDTTISDTIYNGWVDWYNSMEDLADDKLLVITRPDNTTYEVGSLPQRPRPIHRP